MKSHSHINSAITIIRSYTGKEPLSIFLKSYFRQNKKFGSRDRKLISHLCYCYFRVNRALDSFEMPERLLTAYFLCTKEKSEFLSELKPVWNQFVNLPVDEKISLVPEMNIDRIFPLSGELSSGIEADQFNMSFLIQPDLFLRLRPGFESVVKEKLRAGKISFQEISPTCISLQNSQRIHELIALDKEAVVQDFNSQQTGNVLTSHIPHRTSYLVYDCCAGSGGKSILVYDLFPAIDLTVSDSRPSILFNLKSRFEKAGIRTYRSFVVNLSNDQEPVHHTPTTSHPFDLVIADVPCTGSGTWSRTPEQLNYFLPDELDRYCSVQKKIVSNVIPQVKENGYLFYITCSVFKKENEDIVDFIEMNHPLRLIKMELLKGYTMKADTLFCALFQKAAR